MRILTSLLSLGFAVPAIATAKDTWAFGNGFYTGPSTNAHIVKASWSLVQPSVPSNVTVENASDQVWVSLWIGLSSTAGDYSTNLYQPLLNWSPDQESQGCAASASEWCVAASTYTPDGQKGQSYVTVPQDTQVDFEVAVESNKVVQTVSMNGKVVSKESDDPDSDLLYLYSGDECYTGSGTCGTLEGYSYDNITIYLNAPDDNFGKTLNLYSGTSSAGLTTSDNGKTWSTKAINIASDEFTNAQ
ncbi:hypothetical protein BJX96DRAFT_178413 [Aspergillus floccosus]